MRSYCKAVILRVWELYPNKQNVFGIYKGTACSYYTEISGITLINIGMHGIMACKNKNHPKSEMVLMVGR